MSDMEIVTATAFKQAVGEYGDKARRRPVLVTRHDRPWVVVMDAEEYHRLKQYDTRQALHPSELSDELKAEMEKGFQGDRDEHLDHLMD